MAQPLTNEPRDLLLGDDNDLVITTDLQFSTGIQAVLQSGRIAMQLYSDEWFLDLDAGIRYWQDILAKKPDAGIAAAKSEFRRELNLIPGVLKIERLEVTYVGATRALNVKWQVKTGLGETPVDTIALAVGGA